MNRPVIFSMVVVALSIGVQAQQQGAPNAPAKVEDHSPHTVQFVTVDHDVKLEVLDWGGSGRPVVLLAGLGYDAHVFDTFAPKLSSTCHVYGITR